MINRIVSSAARPPAMMVGSGLVGHAHHHHKPAAHKLQHTKQLLRAPYALSLLALVIYVLASTSVLRMEMNRAISDGGDDAGGNRIARADVAAGLPGLKAGPPAVGPTVSTIG